MALGSGIKIQSGYTTHLITENAVQFIEQNHPEPFFLLVAHEAVHLPFQLPDDTPENRQPVRSQNNGAAFVVQ